MKNTLWIIIAFAAIVSGVTTSFSMAAEPTTMRVTDEIRLWLGTAPGVPSDAPAEVVVKERIRQVSVPTIRAWLPAPAAAPATAIIVCPGGGYAHLAFDLHAGEAANYFVPRGIAVIGLKYRVRPPSTDPAKDALADVRRAVRVVRGRAAEWGIDPNRIGIMGYSAGANACLNLIARPDSPAAGDDADAIDRISSRPDFGVLLCTWSNGKSAADFPISVGAPSVFIAAVDDDKTAPVSFSKELAESFTKANVPIELRTYAVGGHGGLHIGGRHAAAHWPDAMLPWLESQGLLRSGHSASQPAPPR